MKVANVCSRPAVSAGTGASLSELATLMRQRNVGAIVITAARSGTPVAVGVVTDRDIVRAQLDHTADLSRLSAEQVMSRDPLVLTESCDIDDAIQRMRRRCVRRAPVVSDSGDLVGVVSTDDLIASVALNLAGLAGVLAKQPHA